MYCPDLFKYERRKTLSVQIGNVYLGGDYPIRIQSMTSTSTMDTEGSVAQCKRIVDAGADYVRLTAQGVREAENLALIRAALRKDGYEMPLVADIHFNPKAADAATHSVEKVRINPGNYVDPAKRFSHIDYTDEEYSNELQKIRERLVPFLNLCKQQNTTIRIGVNHGSLSDRILNRYGDTPAGMVESCLEFLRICVEESFLNIVLSIKASNPLIMVQTVRLLVTKMNTEGMKFPLHLGVTEAGDGEDGRIKSAVGIGALLIDGIGDTIRVSLSEDPEFEIPVAKQIVKLVEDRVKNSSPLAQEFIPNASFDPYSFHRRETVAVGSFGGEKVPPVILDVTLVDTDFTSETLKPDFVYVGKNCSERKDAITQLCDISVYTGQANVYPVSEISEIQQLVSSDASIKFVKLSLKDATSLTIKQLKGISNLVILLTVDGLNGVAEWRAIFHALLNEECQTPVVLWRTLDTVNLRDTQLASGIDFGALLLDGFGDAVMLSTPFQGPTSEVQIAKRVSILFGVLQSTRLRISKTEYISCPSCGRTLFDLQHVIAQIKAKTSHLKGLKIGIMGCIVNGPGEMADADYGYVGAGRGQVSLYKKKECVERAIPTEQALDKLITLIKLNGDWVDPE